MKKLILIILLFQAFLSCKKKPADTTEPPFEEDYKPVQITCTLSNDLDTIKALIPGTWEWLEEKQIIRGQAAPKYITPKIRGYIETRRFSNDTLYFYKNNKPDSIYLYAIVRLKEITGLNFPQDEWPVLLVKNLWTGDRDWYVPVKICKDFLILQAQYVSSIRGEQILKRQ